ncbi:GNAT family N-acetyltransferase [Chryseolinea lacunae]|uniref:GNAT family N-acetyltransferase n=1 Tax=Chryseolinea lacunae TaxID=2801331 RepID=A0ABS1KLH7_9BACT|nr:GNAT family N-acetyltransferase [Chryseolinea lacunae]MBL0740309.1 GNAT family N-acetyltransferase [Chryseolinea lacunae]
MGDYIFHEAPLPADFTFDFEESLFNTAAYRLMQFPQGWHSFYAVDRKQQTIVASFHLHLAQDFAQSPARAPFGSVECADSIPPVILFQFIGFVDSRIKTFGAARIQVKQPPAGYAPQHAALLQTFFLNLGYTVVDAEVGTMIPISQDFSTHLHTWENRKLKQAQSSGLVFRQVASAEIDAIYLFILACRKQKGYALSMSLPEVRAVAEKLPQHYLLFGVYEAEILVAASIAIVVNKRVLYNFYSAHDNAFDHLSPVVLLLQGMYDYAAAHGMQHLDLGTSAIDGKPNFGLLDFKLRLGGVPSSKFTFQKILV